jgi:hypothetical protein
MERGMNGLNVCFMNDVFVLSDLIWLVNPEKEKPPNSTKITLIYFII